MLKKLRTPSNEISLNNVSKILFIKYIIFEFLLLEKNKSIFTKVAYCNIRTYEYIEGEVSRVVITLQIK